jgi:hypothetical protein
MAVAAFAADATNSAMAVAKTIVNKFLRLLVIAFPPPLPRQLVV